MVSSIQIGGSLPQVVKRMKMVTFIEEDTKVIDDSHDDALVCWLFLYLIILWRILDQNYFQSNISYQYHSTTEGF